MKHGTKRALSLLLSLLTALSLCAAALAAGGEAEAPSDRLYVYTDPTAVTLNVGEQQGISTAVTNADGAVTYTWSTDNSSVATVSESGSYATVTARGIGTATITVTAYRAADGDRDSASVSVTVKSPGGLSVSADPGAQTLTVGDTLRVETSAAGADGTESYLWFSNNVGVASVAGSGAAATVTANSAGTAIITVNANRRSDGMNASATVNITVNPRITNISVNRDGEASYTLKTGQEQALSASVSGGSGNCTYSWSASGSVSVRSQNRSSATVTAGGAGSGTVTLNVRDSGTGSTGAVSWSFSVTAPVTTPATPAELVGKPAGEYFATDIVTTVNGTPIESVNVGGRTLISAEDLSYHGFRVVWNGSERTLSVSRGGTALSGGPPVSAASRKVGSKLGDYYYTDIVTYLDGSAIPAYNTGGRTWFCAEDMSGYGYSVVWNAGARTLSVTAE